jgi:hypothetical protein
MKKKTGLGVLLGAVLAGALGGCDNSKEIKQSQTKPKTAVTKVESFEGYKECNITGRSYSPSLRIDRTVHVSYGTRFLDGGAHSHDVPIEIFEPEKFYLFVEIDERTFVREVDRTTFRRAKTNGTAMVKYIERKKTIYKAGSAEAEKLDEKFSDLEIISLELKE